MSKFFSTKYKNLVAYVPGEQPKDTKYIKLNTNESPFPPHKAVIEAAAEQAGRLQLYSDPECTELVKRASERFGVNKDEMLMTNGSDEILNFAFMAFCDADHPIAFPDITYGFYPVFAELGGIPYKQIPLKEDLSVDYRDYLTLGMNIVIANPNAPTGLALPLWQIEEIVKSNPDNIVIIDEAYVDFGAQSAVSLIHKYDNLIVTQTFSKSRSMAGARLGFGIANRELISDMNTVKYSTNPYNVNRMSAACGAAAIENDSYYMDNCKTIISNREYTKDALRALGFTLTDSLANFVFAKSSDISGEELYLELKSRGILIRHFSGARIADYNRITVGELSDMKTLINNIGDILKQREKSL